MADPIRDRLADRLYAAATNPHANANHEADAANAILEAIDARIAAAMQSHREPGADADNAVPGANVEQFSDPSGYCDTCGYVHAMLHRGSGRDAACGVSDAEPYVPTPVPFTISSEQFRDACDAVRPYIYASSYYDPPAVVTAVLKALGIARFGDDEQRAVANANGESTFQKEARPRSS